MKSVVVYLLMFFVSILNAQNLNGTWVNKNENSTILVLIQDGYFTRTVYTPTEFVEAIGGPYTIQDDFIQVKQEFDTAVKKLRTLNLEFEFKGENLMIDFLKFIRLDDGDAPLAGVWRISARKQGENLVEIHQTGTRKTLKLVTGTYFQWFAIDPAENLFLGTGGGTYTFKEGKYIENIEFFSRDNNRVGASLSFDGEIQDEKWIHSGLSSKGEPIYEIWEKAIQ